MSAEVCGCDVEANHECAAHHLKHAKYIPGSYSEPEISIIPPNWGPIEVRVTDPTTGGQKGSKLCQLGAVDPKALEVVGQVAGFGSGKYERYNFAKGFRWSLSYDAMQRHLMAFWGGENLDPESGLPHLGHAAWHCLTLLTFSLRGKGTDDRFPS